MIPSYLDDSLYKNWYFDKSNPIHKGNTGKLSKRSFRAMKRVSPYPLKIKYTPILNKAHQESLTVSMKNGRNLVTAQNL